MKRKQPPHATPSNGPLLELKRVQIAYGGIPFMPETFYIGRDGKVVDKVVGLIGKSEIAENVKKALAQGQAMQAQK